MGEQYRYIGKVMPRKDARDIVTGETQYMDDLRFRDLLYGRVLRSPHAHANITRIDTTKAAGLRGVEAVLTYKDIPDYRGGTPRNVRVLDRKMRFVGDAVALVAARTPEIAEEALGLIEVEYEVLPAVFDIDSALAPGAPAVYDEFPDNILPGGTIIYGPECLKGVVRGDTEKGFAEADVIAEGTFGYENIPNAMPPESIGAVAIWEDPNKVTVYGTTQAPYMDKVTLFHVFNRQLDIRTIGSQCGGGFGTKIMCWQVESYAVLLSKATRRPVKVVFHQGRAPRFLRAPCLVPDQGPGGHEEGRHPHRHCRHVVRGYGILLLHYPGPGGGGLGRAHDHGPVPELGPEKHHCRHEPERVGFDEGLRGAGAEVLFHPHPLPCHGKGGPRPLRGAEEEFRQARRRLTTGGTVTGTSTGASISPLPWTGARKSSGGRRNGKGGSPRLR